MTKANKTMEIKKNSIKLHLKIDRESVTSVVETPDGVVFQFKNGYSFSIEDNYMPPHIKAQMQVADSKFQDHNLVYDLDSSTMPVIVMVDES